MEINKFKLIPATKSAQIHLDIFIDDRPLLSFFAGRRGALPDLIFPLIKSSSDVNQEHTKLEFQRFLLQAPSDFPNHRNSILVCAECGDLGCGAISAHFEADEEYIKWSKFGFQNDYDPDSLALKIYERVKPFIFLKQEYEAEFRKHLF